MIIMTIIMRFCFSAILEQFMAIPLAQSLMPAGLDKTLSAEELRDLMTYLLNEAPHMRDYPSLPRDGVEHAPVARTTAELAAILAGAPDPPAPTKPIEVTLVAAVPRGTVVGTNKVTSNTQLAPAARLPSVKLRTEVPDSGI